MKILNPDKKYSLPKPQSITDELLYQLQRASSNWYKTNDPQYVKQFHDIYHKLRLQAWDGGIDADTELPANLMPEEYLNQSVEFTKHHGEKVGASASKKSRIQANHLLVVEENSKNQINKIQKLSSKVGSTTHNVVQNRKQDSRNNLVANLQDFTYKEQFDLLSYNTNEYEISVDFIKQEILPKLPEHKRLLDIGAFSGNFVKPLSSMFEGISLVEPNTLYYEELMHWGEREQLKIEGYNGDWLNYDFEGEADLVIMSHLLYFVSPTKRKAFVEKAYASIKERGFLVIILISATSGVSHLYHHLLSPKDCAEIPSIESVVVDMYMQGYEHMELKLFDAVIDIPNKASMDYLIDFLVLGKIDFNNPKASSRRDAYIARYLQNNKAYEINSNIGLLILRKVHQ